MRRENEGRGGRGQRKGWRGDTLFWNFGNRVFQNKWRDQVILTTNIKIMNLKYNRIEMKNQARDERCSMKLRERPTLANKNRVCRKKSIREKR